MGAFVVITTLAGLLLSAGISVSQLYTQIKNQQLRDAIQTVASKVSSALKSGRLSASRLMALLQNKNTAALQQYLYNNPMTSKSFSEIQADSDLLAELNAKLNHVESLISQYQSELAALGYSSSVGGLSKEAERAQAITKKLNSAVEEHSQIEGELQRVNITPYREHKVDTSHLDAISQNLQGGLTNG